MKGALPWLLLHSARNRAWRVVGRLKEPRRAIAVAVGVAYLTWAIQAGAAHQQVGTNASTEFAIVLGSIGLLISCLSAWFSGTSLPLGFSPAEVAFLLPAPLKRETLLGYKLVAVQVPLLLNAVIWTLLTSGSRVPAWQRGVAVWLLFTVLTLHRHIAGVLRSTTRELGTEGQRRAIAGASFAMVASALVLTGGAGSLLVSATDSATALRAVLEQPWVSIPLWPFRTLLTPLIAPAAAGWVPVLGPALALLALHVAAVFLVDRVAEELVVRASLRKLDRSDPGTPSVPARPAAPVWRVGPAGSDWAALIWLHVTTGVRRPRLLALLAFGLMLLVAIAVVSARSHLAAEILGAMALVWGGFVFAFGPQYLRNDLRSELGRLALRRAWPIPGSTQIICAVLSATLLLVPLVLWFLTAARIGLGATSLGALQLDLVWPAALLVLPGLCWLALLVQNGGAVLFPEWVAGTHGRGIEVLGLNLVVTAMTLLVVSLLGAVPGIAALVLWTVTGQTLAGSVLGGWLFLVGVALVSWPLTAWLGRELDRLEPVAVE